METCGQCGMAVLYLFDARRERTSEYSWFCIGAPGHVAPDARTAFVRAAS